MTRTKDIGRLIDRMGEWPQSWSISPDDIPIGAGLRDIMLEFVRAMADSGLSYRTIRRHVDNLWLLGGELISDVNLDSDPPRAKPKELIVDAIEGEGGPLLRHASEAGQASFDSTCSKFFKYLARESGGQE